MNASLPRKLELMFWDFAIPVLSTNPTIQHSIRAVAGFLRDQEKMRLALFILAGAFAGFISGILLFLATRSFI